MTNGLNQYTSSGGVGLSYDGLGDVTNDTRLAYGYDGLGKLLTLSNGATLSYDPADNLYQTTGGATTRFLYLGSTIIGEYDASGNVLARYVPGAATDEVAGWYDHPGAGGYANRRYDLTDRQGSVVAVTDDSGNVLGINTYDESGNPGSNNVGRFQYDGAPWIPEAGLYHLRARDYSTTLGRFLQADPIGYGDGLNFYNYVHGDPVNGFDPSGTDETGDICSAAECSADGGGGGGSGGQWASDCTGTWICGSANGQFVTTTYVNPGCGDCGHWGNSVYMKNVPAGDYTEVGTGRTVTSDGTLSSWVQPWVSDSSGDPGSFEIAQSKGIESGEAMGEAIDARLAELFGEGTASRGSTGRTAPKNLNEQLAKQQVRAAPGTGQPVPVTMTDPRWPASEGWVKMQMRFGPINIHYVFNTKTGDVDDINFK